MKIPLDWLSHAADIAAKATHPTTITLTTEGFIIVALSNASPAATATSEIKFKDLAGSVASPRRHGIQGSWRSNALKPGVHGVRPTAAGTYSAVTGRWSEAARV